MGWLAAQFHPPRLIFRDPVFARDREQVVALCRALREARFAVPWECESRPEHFDAPLLRSMKEAGCRVIKLGLETADAELLVALRRVPDELAARRYLAHTRDIVRVARRAGLTVRLFVMAGLPGQTEAAVRQTAQFVQKVKPNALHVMTFSAYAGLSFGEEGAAASVEGPAHREMLDAVAQELERERPARRRWAFWRR